MSKEGFFGPAAFFYHRKPPTGWTSFEGALRPRAFDLAALNAPSGSPWDAPVVLSTLTVMDKVTVSRASTALHERKMVERDPNGADGRSHRVGLTASGAALYADIAPLALAYEARLLEAFTPFERQTVQSLLRRLQDAAVAAHAT